MPTPFDYQVVPTIPTPSALTENQSKIRKESS
jgi:hypothetical protein